MDGLIDVRLIGFGEAAMAFAGDGALWAATAFDIKSNDPGQRAQKAADYAANRVTGADGVGTAVTGGDIVVSLVTAGQALVSARSAAPFLAPGALYLDMNSVAPATKLAAAAAIAAAGGQHVDVAVMAPVHPGRRATPLLLSGPATAAAAAALAALGFSNVKIVGSKTGQASAIKMIRSVMVKGMEALAAECAVAARRAGVLDEVLASLGPGWPADIAYRLERMTSHGGRRAEEMAEVAATLLALGVPPAMASITQGWQDRLGRMGIAPDLDADTRLAAIDDALGNKRNPA
jgi:3-hydroxyisobutyrate dehydrogenase-like beta-hydroxyacid dehydrogenase